MTAAEITSSINSLKARQWVVDITGMPKHYQLTVEGKRSAEGLLHKSTPKSGSHLKPVPGEEMTD